MDKRFPLPKPASDDFEKKRELVGLFKQGPLETNREFAERVYKETMKALAKHQAKQQARRSKSGQPRA
jgi:hypothetical protein